MGSPADEVGREPYEGADETQHKVTLTKGFYMGVHLVTQEQWQSVMGINPSSSRLKENLPVETLSWEDCQGFIKALRKKDGKSYRFPSEAEWEFACRAGTTTPFHFGETISTDQAHYYPGNLPYGTKNVYRKRAAPVGRYPVNAWGLHDMHGNVWEYCQDRFGDYPHNDTVDPHGPDAGKYRVMRGGSFHNRPEDCRSACRGRCEPVHRSGNVGFRLCFCPD